eukprot:GHVS01040240.1.p1 GENE.GHVS01040240.1~~GHVS01040240.1.p1  ORF type:complete len:134 (-),score=20.92 GHVS01040240.1:643-1044(-)
MLNFIPKRCPSVSLLFGKRPLQRIEVGEMRHQVEIPISVVEKVYEKIDTSRSFHNNDYNPMKWPDFVNLKLDVYYLTSAALAGDQASKTALTNMDWYPQISALYAGQKSLTEVDIAANTAAPKLKYPVQGKNI